MFRESNILEETAAAEIREHLQGARCQGAFVRTGGVIGLDLVGKSGIKSKVVAGMGGSSGAFATKHPERRYGKMEGRIAGGSLLLIWCTWRIVQGRCPLASSDNRIGSCEKVLARLKGKTVKRVEISSSWDLRLGLTSGLVLSVFPDRVGPSFDSEANWELWRLGLSYLIGATLTCEVIDREGRTMQLKPAHERWQVDAKANACA